MTSVLEPPPKSTQSHQQAMAYVADLILQTCRASPEPFYLRRLRTDLARTGIKAAVAAHDTPALFGWLMDVLSYQGVSDAVAWAYMEQHGRITWADIDAALNQNPPCPKLRTYTALSGCQYSKGRGTCAEPDHRPGCPLPRHNLRKGTLNRAAYSLYLFLQDECAGDLVAGSTTASLRLMLPAHQIALLACAMLSSIHLGRCTGLDPRCSHWLYLPF